MGETRVARRAGMREAVTAMIATIPNDDTKGSMPGAEIAKLRIRIQRAPAAAMLPSTKP
jgi:hypothetical protein